MSFEIVRPGALRPSVSSWGHGHFKMDTKSKEWQELRRKVLERDDHRCQFCGYRARVYQTALRLDVTDMNHEDIFTPRIDNLVTACRACSSILRFDVTCKDEIFELWESTMPQEAIVQMCREAARERIYGLQNTNPQTALVLTGRKVWFARDSIQPADDSSVEGLAENRYSLRSYADMLRTNGNVVPDFAKNVRVAFTERFTEWQLEYQF